MRIKRYLGSRVSSVVFLAVIGTAVLGCGGDDAPTQPTNQTSEFDETTARAQAQSAGPQAVNLVQSMSLMAQGFSVKPGAAQDDEYGYGWNEIAERWEWRYTWSQDGSEGSWFYTVQYLDTAGGAQKSPLGALTIRHAMNGTSSYHYADGGTVSNGDYAYIYDTTITGLGTDVLLLTGGGSWDYNLRYTSGGRTYDYDYEVKWAILDSGLSLPVGGCPTGTIRYHMDPYRLDVVFNGTETVTSRLFDDRGAQVSGGSYTHAYPCD